MGTIVEQLLGAGPSPCPLKSADEQYLGIYSIGKMAVLVTKKGIGFPEGTHNHNDYEFFIPLSQNIPTIVEKRKLTVEKNKLITFNAGQEHGTTCPLSDVYFIGLHIDKDFLQGISSMGFNKEEVVFQNDNFQIETNIQKLVQSFVEEHKNRQAGYELILESLCTQIAVSLLRQVKNNLQVSTTRNRYSEKENINRAVEFLRELYNKDYSLEELARVANLSPYHFIRVFKAQTGKTPYEYLLDVKIEKAREMLRQKRFTITEVCLMCGFNNLSHFTAVFKRKVGVSPSSYRKIIIRI